MSIETANSMVRNNAVLIHSLTCATSTEIFDNSTEWRLAGGTTLLVNADSTLGGIVTVQYDKDDKIGFLVNWLATRASTQVPALNIAQGSLRRAWQRDQGAFTLRLCAQSSGSTGKSARRWFVGPFETARFALQSDSTLLAPVGRNYVRFTMTGTTSTARSEGKAHIVAFRMPDVQYAT